jgi:hypothetical protein
MILEDRFKRSNELMNNMQKGWTPKTKVVQLSKYHFKVIRAWVKNGDIV